MDEATVFAVGQCFACHRVMTFHPNYVPSLRVNAQGQPDPCGTREPVCRECINMANEARAKRGMPPHEIHPLAYSEAPAESINWEG